MQAFAVWYASTGCLPDSDHPEYIGETLSECERWIESNKAEYERPEIAHDLYDLSISPWNSETETSEWV
jgi:hypothetical protein